MDEFILSIDQGTTSTRTIIFDKSGTRRAVHQVELTQHYPENGWVEHDPMDIWQATLTCCREVVPKVGIQPSDIAAVGISNQRETTVIWDKNTGKPVYNAIVWQDRRTAAYCKQLATDARIQKKISDKTGLCIDPYFCATKIKWLLDNVSGLRDFANNGSVLFGTIDSFLLWNLTGRKVHATDATNASRTLLFNIHTQQWDDELLELFDIPRAILPEVKDCAAHFGVMDASVLGASIPITGIAGDQQAATVGQACFNQGMIKSTYGTGCFIVLNTGEQAVQSRQNLLTTIAYRLDGQVTYALEGSIFVAGAAIQWLRDGLHLFANAKETEALAKSVQSTQGVYLVPAFTGLGAPYWDPLARGAILGLTRDTSIADIVRAALEAVCYQTNDLLTAFRSDYQGKLETLRVDGGMMANGWLIQFLSDVLNVPVERPVCIETSALGAAYLAGLGVGLYQSTDDIVRNWQSDLCCNPAMDAAIRNQLLAGWAQSIERVKTH